MANKTKWTEEQFRAAVPKSYSIAQVLKTIGLKATGANYKTIHIKTEQFGLDTSHWTGQGHLKGKTHSWATKIDLTEILVEKSTYSSTSYLKSRLIKAGIFTNQCSICKNGEWCGKNLVIQLDHINGNNRDNRIENLRMLCPNCHSQTDNFAGKKLKLNLSPERA